MLTEEEVKKLEEQNELQRRFDDANNQRIVNEQMRSVNREQARNDAWHEANARAHERFMESRRRFIERNPNAVSPFESKAVFDQINRNALQKHEMEMLRQQGANELAVAEQKRFGMKEQGRDAAEWGFKGEEVKAKTGLTQAELDAASKTKIAELDAEAKKYGADRGLEASKSQHGYFDEKGVYHPGGNVAAAEASGKAALEVEHIRGQATVGAAEAKARADMARQAEINKRKLSELNEKTRKDIESAARGLVDSAAKRGQSMSYEEALYQVMKGRGSGSGSSWRSNLNW